MLTCLSWLNHAIMIIIIITCNIMFMQIVKLHFKGKRVTHFTLVRAVFFTKIEKLSACEHNLIINLIAPFSACSFNYHLWLQSSGCSSLDILSLIEGWDPFNWTNFKLYWNNKHIKQVWCPFSKLVIFFVMHTVFRMRDVLANVS